MDATVYRTPERAVLRWVEDFNAALAAGTAGAMADLFEADSHWRDTLALTWTLKTTSGRETIAADLAGLAANTAMREVAIDPDRCPPRTVRRAGAEVVEAFLTFQTDIGRCAGLLRMVVGSQKAWTLLTTLEAIRGHEEETLRAARDEPAVARAFHGPNWLDKRQDTAAYADRDPAVLVVGGGHGGITAAARLGQLGIDTLVVDKMARVGDNWRLRYHGLKLHNTLHSNHLPYLPFPETFPSYIPKDLIANWLEFYVDVMAINFWTRTSFDGADWDEAAQCWTARLTLDDGSTREMRPRHIIMATSVSGTPNIPEIPTLENFQGTVLHSSQFGDGAQWRDRPVMVFGTGTSAHDIAQDLQGNGAKVTMVQRSPTLVVNIEPSAQLYDGVFLGPGPSRDDRDLITLSVPLALMKVAHREITDRVKDLDKPLLDGLEKAGFRLDFGEDGTGWPLKYRTRGGGYYFNVGCSELIADGKIGLIQYADIDRFTPGGVAMTSGEERPADLVVLATGYKNQDHLVRLLFGEEVAERAGPVWNFNPETQELRNMWMATGQPGLWFTGGAFSQCRVYSKYLALQIQARELGMVG